MNVLRCHQDDMMVALCVHHNIISKKACHNKLCG